MWTTGQSTDYLDALQDLVELATNSHVTTAAVNAGGSGYAVGNILRINGGTTVGGHTAAVEVLTLSGSAVATVRIARGGAYTVNPGTGASTTAETGSGTGCTINTTIASTGWTLERRTREAVSATIATGGSGYAVGNQLTLVDEDSCQGKAGVDAVFQVSTTSGGAVTAVTLVTAGNYEKMATNPIAVTGGAGTGCTLNVTSQVATTQDQVVVLSGSPTGGFDAPYVAFETYQEVDQFVGTLPVRNWMILGLTNFDPNLPLFQQGNISPCHDLTLGNGGYLTRTNPNVALKAVGTAFPIKFWFSITERRIIGFFEVTDATPVFCYPQFYVGFYNQAGTSGEFPYPMYVGASSWRTKAYYAETTPVMAGLSMASGETNDTGGTTPASASGFLWESGHGRWIGFNCFTWNAAGTTLNSGLASGTRRIGIYPLMDTDSSAIDPLLNMFGGDVTDAVEFFTEIIDRSLPSAPEVQLHPTPGAGGDLYLLIPLTLWAFADDGSMNLGLNSIYGELDQCFYLSAAPPGSGPSTLDTFLIGTSRYRVFQNGNRTTFNWAYQAVLEA